MEVLAEDFPDLAVVACEQRLQWNPLRIQHARDVMIGDDEEFGGRAEGGVAGRRRDAGQRDRAARRWEVSRRFDRVRERYRAWRGRGRESGRDSLAS